MSLKLHSTRPFLRNFFKNFQIRLTSLVPLLYTPVIHCDSDPINAIALVQTINNMSEGEIPTKDFESSVPPLKSFAIHTNSEPSYSKCEHLFDANLATIVSDLFRGLQFNLEDKHFLIGYCNALALLSKKYPITEYLNSWECDGYENSIATQLTRICLNLLTTNPTIMLDLSAHQNVLTLTANLLEGLAYNIIKSNFKKNITQHIELDWGLISHINISIAQLLDNFFTHLLRILNIYSSIIDEPVSPPNLMSSITNYNKMPVIQSISNSPLSPIKKKSSPKSSDFADKNDKKTDSEKTDKDKFTKFGSNPLLIRFTELIRSSYISNKTMFDLKADKMLTLINSTLNSLGSILEFSTIKFISRYVEEVLYYLRVVFSLEPCLAVKNIRQLLKCIFGTNFIVLFAYEKKDENEVEEEEEEIIKKENSTTNKSTFNSSNSSEVNGLYNTCLSSPYTKFTQFYATMSSRINSSFGSNDETDLTLSSWLRKKIEKRVSMILDKSPSSGSLSSLNSKTCLTSHIRLFEPVVIKALKQYTITSDISFQCEVLDLLSQLVQLRVNYCLLDSEQIFIGFVLKQFEFIENGHFDRYDQLIGHIFFFLILLSYERYHSKPIIGIPKIIQLCDGILASGHYPHKFALPSLQPIVEDLILLRNPSKVDSSKDLEAQREVIIANCLKLVQFPRILRILVIVTKQSKREGEEKWKKISRQITDTLLPQLVKQTIQIDSYDTLNSLHQLFESVSPSVFRPVDILLKALFAAPQPDITDNYYYFHRWTSLILVILRLLIVQVKEEVVLARLEELKSSIVTIGPFGLPVIPMSSFVPNNSIPFHMSSIANRNDSLTLESEEMFAEYLLQIIQMCSNEFVIRSKSIYEDIRNHSDFLCQQMANYMLILTHMFQSGSFRRVAKAAMNLIKKSQELNEMPEDLVGESYLNGFSLHKTNASFLKIQSKHPTLSLQWFNLLMLLNYEESIENGLWDHLIRPDATAVFSTDSKVYLNTKRRGSISKSKNIAFYSPSVEIMRRGALILFCDFVCENMNDAEHMTWLIVYNINEIIKLCHESPVTEFISAIHRNSASSGLFIQAINARCDDNLKTPNFLRRLLTCLERVHPSQSLSLITFLIEKILSNPNLQSNYLLMGDAEKLAIKRLNLLDSSVDSYSNKTANHFSAQDLDKFIVRLNSCRYTKLVATLESLRTDPLETSQTSHPLIDSTSLIDIPEINKEWFLNIMSKYCKKYTKDHKVAHLLNRLSYEDIVTILSSKDFALEILGDCIEFGDHCLIEEDKINTKIMFSVVMNRINLLKASLNSVLHHISYFISILPNPHFPFLAHSEMITPKEARHRDKMIEFFSQDNLWTYLFKLSSGFLSFLEHHSERSIASDLLPNIARISVLYSESIQYMTETIENISFSHLITSLNIIGSSLTCNSIFTFLSSADNISYQCSIISSVHSLAKLLFHDLPNLEEPDSFTRAEKENPEWKHPHKACIRMAQLICLIESDAFSQSRAVPQTVHTLIKKVILLTARLPLVNSFVMVPWSVWTFKNESSWNPRFAGDFGTVVPTIPSEFLHFKDILDQFCFRVMNLGWTCRVQFEEIWMSLLGVLGANSAYVEPNDELSERIIVCMATTEAMSQLLLLSSLSPQPGNPIRSKFLKQKSEKIPTFLHSNHGVKLQLVREPLMAAINLLSLNDNETNGNSYDFGQISVELLRLRLGSVNSSELLSPSMSSTSSSSDYSPLSPSNSLNANKSISSNQDKLEIDLNSCLHFLLDLYGQLLSAQQPIQLPLLTEICKSTALLSDLFTERTQFEWLLDTFLELHRMSQISEDEIMSQYLIVGICKASAVLGLETEQIIEKCKKCVESSLKSHYLPTRISTLHGLSYLLEFRGLGANGKETVFLPIASDYLLKHLSDTSLPSSHNTEHVELMWRLSFHLIEFFVNDFNESEFAQKIFQLSIKVLTDKYSKVYHLVSKSLEHLILCEKFSIKESNIIVKSGLDRFKTSNCQLDALLAFNLILSSTYFVGSVGLDLEKDMDDSEEFLLAMEKLSVIFERLKACHSFEAQQICNVLPHFLYTFFPKQDILNKCIGEFLSGQQTHSKHLANILFIVFNKLQTESRLDIVHDWVLLSLSSFTQLNPMSLAIWSLTSFLISASVNPWIRCSFSYLLTRFGLLEESDRQLFYIVCHNFYNELKTEQNRETFRTTFQSINCSPDSPYCEVLRYLQIAKS